MVLLEKLQKTYILKGQFRGQLKGQLKIHSKR